MRKMLRRCTSIAMPDSWFEEIDEAVSRDVRARSIVLKRDDDLGRAEA
jgi:hypothetical protein